MKALLITVVGILLGLAASLGNIVWLSVLAAVVALMGAYAQYRDTMPYEFIFSGSSWQRAGSGFKLVIPKEQHKKSNPTATVFKGENQTYEEVDCDISADTTGAIVLRATIPFEGKVLIK